MNVLLTIIFSRHIQFFLLTCFCFSFFFVLDGFILLLVIETMMSISCKAYFCNSSLCPVFLSSFLINSQVFMTYFRHFQTLSFALYMMVLLTSLLIQIWCNSLSELVLDIFSWYQQKIQARITNIQEKKLSVSKSVSYTGVSCLRFVSDLPYLYLLIKATSKVLGGRFLLT